MSGCERFSEEGRAGVPVPSAEVPGVGHVKSLAMKQVSEMTKSVSFLSSFPHPNMCLCLLTCVCRGKG